jgi:hypothetical protein
MKDLTKKENWTPEMVYIHRTRLIFGLLYGVLLASLMAGIIVILIY